MNQFNDLHIFKELSDVADVVKPYYETSNRHYHNWEHIIEMCSFLDLAGGNVLIPITLKNVLSEFDFTSSTGLAILFHDICYVAGSDNNEENSVLLMRQIMSELGFTNENSFIENAAKMILSTKNHIGDYHSFGFLDLDMMRLSTDINQYFKHVADIRKEFSQFEIGIFLKGRSEFLKDLISRDFIYHTQYARNRWEANARRNIEIELEIIENYNE